MIGSGKSRSFGSLLCVLLMLCQPFALAGAEGQTNFAARNANAAATHTNVARSIFLSAKRSAKAKVAKATPFYLQGVDLVYVTKTGHCYHAIRNCGRTKYPYAITAQEAARLGYDPCDTCDPLPPMTSEEESPLPEGEKQVYFVVQDSCYHRTDTCSAMKTKDGEYSPVAVTVEEARYLDKTPCKTCKPPKK